MKKLLLLLILLPQLFLVTNVICQWNVIPSGTGAGYAFLDYKQGRLITYGNGENGFLVSFDDGDSFTSYGMTNIIRRVGFSDNNIGYSIVKTSLTSINYEPHISYDSGDTWVPIQNSISTSGITNNNGVAVLNDSTAIFYSSWGNIWRTDNWGNTLNNINDTELISSYTGSKQIRTMYFINDLIGFAATGDIAKTTDGGLSWNKVVDDSTTQLNWTINNFCFPSSNIGYAAGWDGLIIKTTDGGLTWNELNTGTSESLSVDFFTTDLGVAITGNGYVMRTDDGGQTWTSDSTGYNHLSKCKMLSHSKVVIVGGLGLILKTSTLDIDNSYDLYFKITAFPNPTKDFITIEIEGYNGSFEVEIYDLQGRLLETTKSRTISLKKYSKGIYIFRVNYGDINEEVRVLKQ